MGVRGIFLSPRHRILGRSVSTDHGPRRILFKPCPECGIIVRVKLDGRGKYSKFCRVECHDLFWQKREPFFSKSKKKNQKKIKTSSRKKRQKNRREEVRINRQNYAVKSKEFLESREWQSLRYEALKKHGRKCQCCGAKPPSVVLHVDHIKPRYRYPELCLDINNLQVLCAACNMGKGAKHEDDFREKTNEHP